jgi:hypothetical protein
MNSPKVMYGYTNFETLIAPPSVLKKYDWVKHVDPSLLECYTMMTGAVTMLVSSVLHLVQNTGVSSCTTTCREVIYGTKTLQIFYYTPSTGSDSATFME